MALRLYIELLNAYNKKGYAMKKKTDLHNQCQVSFFHSGATPTGTAPARFRGPAVGGGDRPKAGSTTPKKTSKEPPKRLKTEAAGVSEGRDRA